MTEAFAPPPPATEEEGISDSENPNPEPEPDPETVKEGANERTYVVFEQVGPDTYKIIAKVVASDTDEARQSIGQEKLKDTEYAAVAQRYWQPSKPRIEQTTTISW